MIASMVKINGMLRVIDSDRPALDSWKMKVSEGQIVHVNFAKEAPPASIQARKLFHLLRDRYSAGMGYSKEYAKDELCVLFGVSVTMEEALESRPKWAGHICELWGREYIRKTTTAYTDTEMNDLIAGTEKACVENGVDIEEYAGERGRIYAT